MSDEEKRKVEKFNRLLKRARMRKDLETLGDRYGVYNQGWN